MAKDVGQDRRYGSGGGNVADDLRANVKKFQEEEDNLCAAVQHNSTAQPLWHTQLPESESRANIPPEYLPLNQAPPQTPDGQAHYQNKL